jgi:endonuclease/exonuclease/phosphatase family metal-dependent hydrolase
MLKTIIYECLKELLINKISKSLFNATLETQNNQKNSAPRGGVWKSFARKPLVIREEQLPFNYEQQSARILSTLLFLPSGMCLRVVILYGHFKKDSASSQANDTIFRGLQRLIKAAPPMMTVVLGDFNCNPHTIPSLTHFCSTWLDLGLLAANSSGTEPTPTWAHCSGSLHRLDYVFVNKEFLPFINNFEVIGFPRQPFHTPLELNFLA